MSIFFSGRLSFFIKYLKDLFKKNQFFKIKGSLNNENSLIESDSIDKINLCNLNSKVRGLKPSLFVFLIKSFPSKYIKPGFRLFNYRINEFSISEIQEIDFNFNISDLFFSKNMSFKDLPTYDEQFFEKNRFLLDDTSELKDILSLKNKVSEFFLSFDRVKIRESEFKIFCNCRNYDIPHSYLKVKSLEPVISVSRIYSNVSISRTWPFILKSSNISRFSLEEKSFFYEKIYINQKLNKKDFKILAIYTQVPLDSARNMEFSEDFQTLKIDLNYRVSKTMRNCIFIIGQELENMEIFREIIHKDIM